MTVFAIENVGHIEVQKITSAEIELDRGHEFDEIFSCKVNNNQQWYMGRSYNKEVILKSERKQIVVWYPNGNMWCSYGKTFKEAFEGAKADAWRYMK